MTSNLCFRLIGVGVALYSSVHVLLRRAAWAMSEEAPIKPHFAHSLIVIA